MQPEEQTLGHLIDRLTQAVLRQLTQNKPGSPTDRLSQKSSGSKTTKSKLWSPQQQQEFYNLVGKYGTDFSIIKQFLPRKSKTQIKNKFKEEEARNPHRLSMTLKRHPEQEEINKDMELLNQRDTTLK